MVPVPESLFSFSRPSPELLLLLARTGEWRRVDGHATPFARTPAEQQHFDALEWRRDAIRPGPVWRAYGVWFQFKNAGVLLCRIAPS
jgi:hypothetical protein